MERALLEAFLAQGLTLREMGLQVGRDPTTVSYWLRKHGPLATHRQRLAPKGPLSREQLESLIAEGMSEAEIAARVDRSPSTVRHWLVRFDLRTLQSQGRAANQMGESERVA